MARTDGYSRAVAWLKIVLPLLALAILSTLFLVARTIDPADTVPFADVDVEALAREERIGSPTFTAVTEDGAAVSVTAAVARPEDGDMRRILGTDITAGIDLADGRRIDIRAARLLVDTGAGMAELSGDVVVRGSEGYVLRTESLEIGLDETRLVGSGGIEATMPEGRLSAAGFELVGRGDAVEPHMLVFKGDVKLIYDVNE